MSEIKLLDTLLDRWEEALARNPNAELDVFIQQYATKLTPQAKDELQSRAVALADMSRRLDAMKDTAGKSGELPATNPSSSRRSKRSPGQEPIPGYRLVELLGDGGFGTVWKATAPGGFPVALKFVSFRGNAGRVEIRSLKIIRNVRHANILSVVGAWKTTDELIIATELADETLLDRFQAYLDKGHVGIPRSELLDYLRDAARGIDFLNLSEPDSDRPRIQHRDIKPQNLLLSGGSVKVGDFGLVREVAFDSTGHTGSLTLSYAAPEFLEGRTSSRSDQYSLAITFVHLISGRLPFTGSQVQIIDGHRSGLPDLSMLAPDDRPIVKKALAKLPEDRWNTCVEFVSALRDAGVAPPLGAPRKRKPPQKPTRRVVGWSAALILLIGVLTLAIGGQKCFIDAKNNEADQTKLEKDNSLASALSASMTNRINTSETSTPSESRASLRQDFASLESGSQQIFDEKNLDGWSVEGFNGWTVEDGVLIGESRSRNDIGWLMLDEPITNFQLQLEFRLGPGANSGIFLNSRKGYALNGSDFAEIQLIDSRFTNYSLLAPSQLSGSLFGVIAPTPEPEIFSDDWNQLTVVRRAEQLQVTINGKRIIDQPISPMTSGHIGLQLYPGRVEFRNLLLKALGSDLP